MSTRWLAAIAVAMMACSSSSGPGAAVMDGGQTPDGTTPLADANAPADGGVTVAEFTCSGHATLTTTAPPGVPPEAYAIKSFLSTVVTNADGTLTAYSGTDAAANCIFRYTKPALGVATLITPLTCPGPLTGTTATYTSGTSTVMGTSSTVILDADLSGLPDASVTMAKLVESLTCVKK